MPSSTQIIQNALGLAQRGRLGPAIGVLERLVRKGGAPAEAHHFLGMLQSRDGRLDQALYHLERSVTMEPGRPQFESNYAGALAGAGRESDAIEHYQAAMATDPAYALARIGLSGVLYGRGQFADAEREAREAWRLAPDNPQAACNLASCLIVTGRAHEAVRHLRDSIESIGPSIECNTLLAAAVNYDADSPPDRVLEAHRTLGRLHAAAAAQFAGDLPPLQTPRTGARRIRVGYLSADFRDHPVAMFIEPALASDDAVEVFCYDTTPNPDAVSARLRARDVTWREAAGLADTELVAMARRDGLDLLVELSGHSIGNRQTAVAARMAPVQASYLGYPATTGNPVIDVRISDRDADPEGADERCTERLVHLEPGAWCFSEPEHAPSVSTLPSGEDGPITFGSFNNLAKTTPALLDVWARLLAAVPEARLVLKNGAFIDVATRTRVAGELESRRVGADRVTLLAPTDDAAGHLAAYAGVDIALDTFPYAGTTTTCEALWMGVPVVTLAGGQHAGRVGVSLLRLAELELVAADADQYVEIAADLAADRARLATLRASMRGRMRGSALMDRDAYRAGLHGAYAALVSERGGTR